ncbi:hypothetical protein Tco_0756552 [Tanacetum coccineum]
MHTFSQYSVPKMYKTPYQSSPIAKTPRMCSSKRDAEEELDQGSYERQNPSENSEPTEESKEKEDDELSQEELPH